MLPRNWKCVVVYRIGTRYKAVVVRGTSKLHLDEMIEKIKRNLANQHRVPVIVKQKFYS
jgi:hypothetical protein